MRRTRGSSFRRSKMGGPLKSFVRPVGLGRTGADSLLIITSNKSEQRCFGRKARCPAVPMERGSTMMRPRSRGSGSRRDVDSIMKSLGTLPRILCWKCRQLTSFDLDRCQHCGSPFAGGTGGAYRSGRIPTSDSFIRAQNESGIRPRSLREIVEDLQHVRDLAYSPREPPQDEEVSLLLYQCPSCSRFVSQASEDCACGVRFAPEIGRAHV